MMAVSTAAIGQIDGLKLKLIGLTCALLLAHTD